MKFVGDGEVSAIIMTPIQLSKSPSTKSEARFFKQSESLVPKQQQHFENNAPSDVAN